MTCTSCERTSPRCFQRRFPIRRQLICLLRPSWGQSCYPATLSSAISLSLFIFSVPPGSPPSPFLRLLSFGLMLRLTHRKVERNQVVKSSFNCPDQHRNCQQPPIFESDTPRHALHHSLPPFPLSFRSSPKIPLTIRFSFLFLLTSILE